MKTKKEIEIKINIDYATYNRLNNYLYKKHKLIRISEETDEYFSPINMTFLKPRYPYQWMSIRKRDGKFTINYKHFYPEDKEERYFCDELETEIEDPDILKKILMCLNLQSIVVVRKKRIIYEYNKEYEICLDKVDNLGYFIEIEAKVIVGDQISLTRKKIIEIIKRLNIDISKIDYRGYPYQLLGDAFINSVKP